MHRKYRYFNLLVRRMGLGNEFVKSVDLAARMGSQIIEWLIAKKCVVPQDRSKKIGAHCLVNCNDAVTKRQIGTPRSGEVVGPRARLR
ncbi:hypothetical protein DFR50_107169 [Roseiarcus fermentans]|uniref:Uncharacterized protein n=1 Tax=Roseiarcus fermentans TaxID=1473586 RepID=A0A366FQ92_9HYPH|nr:hypothetical protein DFR50_107169 [Roseiarcus fermentans]